MKKENKIKKLQNLFSWKQFYQWNEDFENIEITQDQIDLLQIEIDGNKRN
jgi:hypothetical protein